MANIIEICPHCGNTVEGKIKRSTVSKTTRSILKKGGMKTVLTAAGSVVPGFGNAAGFVAGSIIDGLWGDKINNIVDDATDVFIDDNTYEFSCPKCGHSWINNESEAYDDNDIDDDDDGLSASKIKEIHEVLNIIADELNVDFDGISPNSDLEDDLGASNFKKMNILSALEEWAGTDSSKKYSDFTFVDDFIEEFTGETLWDEEVPALEDDNNISKHQVQFTKELNKFDAIFQSYLNDEYANLSIKEKIDIFVSNADKSSFPFIQSEYFCVASVIALESFIEEWMNEFKNYPGEEKQGELQECCIVGGLNYINECFNITSDDVENKLIKATLTLLKDFWIDSIEDKEYYQETYGTVAEDCNYEKSLFNREWLLGKFNACYEYILYFFDGNENRESTATDDVEQEYLNELKEILADGEISPRERRLLDKIRTQLGISEERAAELEAALSSPSLTPEEQEYLDEFKEIIAEGQISPRDQRFLEKLKKANGISDERAKEIENLVK